MSRILLAILLSLVGIASSFAQSDAPITRIAFGSCADQNKPCPIWGVMAQAKPDLLVLLGDTIYADLNRSIKVTPASMRSNYEKLSDDPGFQTLRRSARILATWDDHDYGKNDAGETWELKDEAQQLFLDFFEVPKNSSRRARRGVYHAEIFGPPGKRVQVIMLDGRYHKTEIQRGKFDPRTRVTPSLPTTDPAATFLGEEQWKWLEEQLKVPAELRLIGSGIQVLSEDHPFEKWMLIPHERQRLFQLLRETKANGVIFLSGDRHLAELSLSTEAIDYPLYDITSSGFNQATLSWRAPEKNRHRVAAMPFGNNFGFISIDWTSERSPRVTLELRDEEGLPVVRHPIRLGLLTPQDRKANVVDTRPLPAGVITPAQARGMVGSEVTVQFRVQSARLTSDKQRLFINSDADFRSEQNFTIVVGKKARAGKYQDATGETFEGKTVQVKGKVSEYQKRPQIEVESEDQLIIID